MFYEGPGPSLRPCWDESVKSMERFYCFHINNKLDKNQTDKPSLIAVQGAPSSCSRRISLRATTESVKRLLPLKTVA